MNPDQLYEHKYACDKLQHAHPFTKTPSTRSHLAKDNASIHHITAHTTELVVEMHNKYMKMGVSREKVSCEQKQ